MNTPRSTIHLLTFALGLGLCACTDSTTSPVDEASSDTGGQDALIDASTSTQDAGGTQDVGPTDATVGADVGEDAALVDAASDASTDAGSVDASMMDAESDAQRSDPRCMFLDLDVRYVRCEQSDYQLLRYFEDRDLGDVTCPPYYVLRGTRYTSPEDALTGEGCDGTCQYTPQNSFTVLRCGVRTGYELWTAADCGDIYVTPNGVYPSVEAWERANPC